MITRPRLLAQTSILLVFAAGVPIAVAAESEALLGQSYASARKALIKDRWVPVHHSEVQLELHDRKIQRRYPELDSCAMDKPVSSFSFKKAGKCMRIITWGEEMESFTVNTITHECLDGANR